MTKDEALKKAFKQAFQLGQDYWYQADHEYVSQNKKSDVTRAKFEQLMEDAIKEALANDTSQECVAKTSESVHEPVGWAEHGVINWLADKQFNHTSFLYDTPPQRKPLTDEEVVKMDEWLFDQPFWRVLMLVRAIEAAHGIKGEA